MKIYNISKSEINKITKQLNDLYSISFEKKIKNVKVVEVDDENLIAVCDHFKIIRTNDLILPFLFDNPMLNEIPKIVVDQGAIKPICSGASIMRPGIVKHEDDFAAGDIISIQEEKFGKFIAIGKALIANSELNHSDKGSVITNLHYIGDRFWKQFNNSGLSTK